MLLPMVRVKLELQQNLSTTTSWWVYNTCKYSRHSKVMLTMKCKLVKFDNELISSKRVIITRQCNNQQKVHQSLSFH